MDDTVSERTLESFVCNRCKGTYFNPETGRCGKCNAQSDIFSYCKTCDKFFSISAGQPCPQDGTQLVRQKAALSSLRLSNSVLDAIILNMLAPPIFFLFGYMLASLGLRTDFFEDEAIFSVFWLFYIFLYYFLSEMAWQRTPAKFITGTKVVTYDGTKPTPGSIVARTLARFVPFEAFSFLDYKVYGWHDKWSRTFVVKSRRLERKRHIITTRAGEQNRGLQENIVTESRFEAEGATSINQDSNESTSLAALLKREYSNENEAVRQSLEQTETLPQYSKENEPSDEKVKTVENNRNQEATCEAMIDCQTMVMNKKGTKWFVFVLLVVILAAIIVVHFSKTPSTIKANTGEPFVHFSNAPETMMSDSGEANAYLIRGVAYAEKGQYNLAISDYTKAIELDPHFGDAYCYLGVAYFNEGANALAITNYTKAIEINPRDAEAYLNRGDAYRVTGEHDLAISDFTKAIEINPLDAEAYFYRGNTYGMTDARELAISDYTKAIGINPRYAEAYYWRGLSYLLKGSHDLAISDCNKAIELNPNYVEAYRLRGSAYDIEGAKDLAISDYTKAIEINPSNAEIYSFRGDVYFSKGANELAISDYTKAIEINPCYSNAYCGRGVVYLNEGANALAISDCTKAIEINPSDVFAYLTRGWAYVREGAYNLAISDLTKVIQIDPRYAEAYRVRGLAYFGKEQYDKALEDMLKAQALGDRDAPAIIERLRRIIRLERELGSDFRSSR